MRPAFALILLLLASTALTTLEAGPRTSDVPAPALVNDRLVSTNLPADEILLSLLPPERLLAVSAFATDGRISNVAELARHVPAKARPGSAADVERLVALAPAAVVLFPFARPEARGLLARCSVPVIELRVASSLAAVEESVRSLGTRVGEAAHAQQLVDEMERRLRHVDAERSPGERPSVLYFMRGYTAGRGTLLNEMIERAGARNVAAEAGIEGHARLDAERILAMDPDYILLAPWRADARRRDVGPEQRAAHDRLLARTRAVRGGHVIFVAPRHLMSTSHFVALGVEDIAQQLRRARVAEESAP